VSELVRAAASEGLWSGEMIGVDVRGIRVLLVNVEGVVRAYHDRCAHLGVPLSEGSLEGAVLTCRAHCWQYDVGTGAGVNPRTATLTALPVVVRDGAIFVDIDAAGAEARNGSRRVGPVLAGNLAARAVAAAIRELNDGAEVEDRGGYVRVSVAGRCVVTRAAIERHLGRAFRIPTDLEPLMPSFSGRLALSEEEARWE